MDPKVISTLTLAAVVVLLFYRRARRSLGRQPVNIPRLSVRAGILSLVGILLTAAIWRETRLVPALAGGVLAGALLAWLALRYTRFEATEQGRFYTPHTYIGLLVLALLVGRILYRFAISAAAGPQLPSENPPNPLAIYEHNPLTLTLLGVLIGYYVLYNFGVLRRSRALAGHPPDTTAL